MSLREAWQRWTGRRIDVVGAEGEVADACPTPPSLLEELALDPEDFADLARLPKVELRTVIATIVATRPLTVASLITQLDARRAAPIAEASAAPEPYQHQQSEGGGEAGGWGRWTRTHGGVRVHRSATAPARPALAAP